MKTLYYIILISAISYFTSCSKSKENIAGGGGVETTGGTLFGTVVDSKGNPIRGASVSIKDSRILKDSDSNLISKSVLSDSLGNYHFEDLDSGRYFLSAISSDKSLGYNEINFDIGKNTEIQKIIPIHPTINISGRLIADRNEMHQVCLIGGNCSTIDSNSVYALNNIPSGPIILAFKDTSTINFLELEVEPETDSLIYIKDINFTDTIPSDYFKIENNFEKAIAVTPVEYLPLEIPDWYEGKNFNQVTYYLNYGTDSAIIWVDSLINKLPPSGSLIGTVFNESGQLVANSFITLKKLILTAQGESIDTSIIGLGNSEGQYSFSSIDTGSYSLVVYNPDSSLGKIIDEILIIKDSSFSYDITLKPTTDINGRLLSTNPNNYFVCLVVKNCQRVNSDSTYFIPKVPIDSQTITFISQNTINFLEINLMGLMDDTTFIKDVLFVDTNAQNHIIYSSFPNNLTHSFLILPSSYNFLNRPIWYVDKDFSNTEYIQLNPDQSKEIWRDSNIVRIILETDFVGSFDVGALAILHGLANLGEAEILGVMVSNLNDWTVPAVDAVNTYYRRPDIPIGNLKSPEIVEGPAFEEQLAKNFPNDIIASYNAPSATNLYRSILQSQPDSSVVIASLAHVQNLSNLLDSPLDSISPLTGKELITKKVKRIVIQGGRYPSGTGSAFPFNPLSAINVIDNWPSPMTFVGSELIPYAKVGEVLKTQPNTNPVREAYLQFNGSDSADWDDEGVEYLVVLNAVRRLKPYWTEHTTGYNSIETNGNTIWKEDADKEHGYLEALLPVQNMKLVLEELIQ